MPASKPCGKLTQDQRAGRQDRGTCAFADRSNYRAESPAVPQWAIPCDACLHCPPCSHRESEQGPSRPLKGSTITPSQKRLSKNALSLHRRRYRCIVAGGTWFSGPVRPVFQCGAPVKENGYDERIGFAVDTADACCGDCGISGGQVHREGQEPQRKDLNEIELQLFLPCRGIDVLRGCEPDFERVVG